MEIGESACAAAACLPPPDVELAAELLSVTFKSPVKVSRARATIAGPHWQRGKEAEIEDDWVATARKMRLPPEPYSKRAAVYLVRQAGGAHDVEVTLRITRNRNVSGRAVLRGSLCGLTIEGTCPVAAGEHTVAAAITSPPEGIQAYRGDIAWTLSVEGAGLSTSLGASLVEVYFILGRPTAAHPATGVWSEVLRFLCARTGVLGESQSQAAVARITSYCHGRHGLRYDTHQGRPFYTVSSGGGSFSLWSYLRRESLLCNCYDQAAAVQALAGALGVLLDWQFLSRFGFLRTADLVGVGQCNNPFFGRDDSKKIVARDSEQRTAFGNHAFIGTAGGRAHDACAGPHLGAETFADYLLASVDDDPDLYRGRHRPGRLSDMRRCRGVSAVE